MIPELTVKQIAQITRNEVGGRYTEPSIYTQEIAGTAPDETSVYSFQEYIEEFKKLEQEWDSENLQVRKRRRLREIDVNIESMRSSGKIAKDETIIPVRIVDTNIRRELPAYISYLIQSRRVAIFKPKDSRVSIQTEPLESEFTRVFRYTGWETELFKNLDGTALHGADAVEVLADSKKPGKFMFRHIGRGKLKFPMDSVDIQANTKIVVSYELSAHQLKKFVKKYGWNQTQVDIIIGEGKDKKCFDKMYEIRKVYFHVDTDDYVRVAFYHPSCSDWLWTPRPLFLGRRQLVEQETMVPTITLDSVGNTTVVMTPDLVQSWVDVYETKFPVFINLYSESESPKILDKRGRAFFDEFKQEAATAIRSSIVNRAVRSSNVYASPRNNTGIGNGIPKTHVNELIAGHIYDNPIDFWSMPSVDPAVVKVDQYLDTTNAQETNQVAWAVQNREDSRKTATEVAAAGQKEAQINTVQVTLFSKFMRELCEYIWDIVRSLAQQGEIDFLSSIPEEKKIELLSINFDVFSAGDTDVIKREEELNRMRIDWPVIATTPIAPLFLAEYLRKAYPDKGESYATMMLNMLQQNSEMEAKHKAMLAALTGMVEQFKDQMTPEQQTQMAQMMQGMMQNEPQQNIQ